MPLKWMFFIEMFKFVIDIFFITIFILSQWFYIFLYQICSVYSSHDYNYYSILQLYQVDFDKNKIQYYENSCYCTLYTVMYEIILFAQSHRWIIKAFKELRMPFLCNAYRQSGEVYPFYYKRLMKVQHKPNFIFGQKGPKRGMFPGWCIQHHSSTFKSRSNYLFLLLGVIHSHIVI